MIWSDFLKECLFGGIAGLKLWRLLVSGSRKQRGLLRLGTRWQLGLKGWNTLSLYFENTTKTVLIVHLTKLRPNLTLQLCSFFPTILAFTIGHLVSRGILALPPTKKQASGCIQENPSPKYFTVSTSINQLELGWCREYLHYGSKGAREGSRVKDGTSSSQHMAAIW